MGRDMLNAAKYITTVPFSALFNWSVQYLNDSKIAFNKKYPMMRIGEFLTRSKDAVTIQNNIKYTRVTIKVRNGGVFKRDEVMGESIGTKKQYRISAGQFILSKIDARNGALGIVPQELNGAIVTQDFLPYDIDTGKINPQYLVLVSTTQQFMAFCQSCSSGTTNRQRIDEAQFLNIKVPIPSLEEQNKLVEEYKLHIKNSIAAETKAKTLEQDILTYLSKSLYVSGNNAHQISKGINIINFSSIQKWGVDYIIKNARINSIYPVTTISSICTISSGGTPSRSNKAYYSGTIPWIKTGELNDNIIYDSEEHISELGVQNSSAKLYPKGSLIIAMYGATIGKTAMLGIDATTNQACAVLTNINNKIIITEYLWEYLKYQSGKLKQLAYGSAQPNINAGIIADFTLIIPPMRIQQKILKKLRIFRNNIQIQKQNAIHYHTLALNNFETKIFD